MGELGDLRLACPAVHREERAYGGEDTAARPAGGPLGRLRRGCRFRAQCSPGEADPAGAVFGSYRPPICPGSFARLGGDGVGDEERVALRRGSDVVSPGQPWDGQDEEDSRVIGVLEAYMLAVDRHHCDAVFFEH